MPLTLTLLLSVLPGVAAARPPTGLLDRDTPLPATIPLQITAPEGRDYAIVLGDADRPVTRAYLRGGEVLRLVMPPGTYDLSVGAGDAGDWIGPDRLFGTSARRVGEPLSFRIDGDRRAGVSIELRLEGDGMVLSDRRDRATCQITTWPSKTVIEETPSGGTFRYLDQRLDLRSRPCG